MGYLLPVVGILAGVISLAAYPPYIRDMVKGTTRPERASWLIWVALSGIALAGQIGAGASWSLYMSIAQTIGTTTVLLLSFRYGTGGLHRKDIISLTFALFGVILWAMTSQPLLAIVLVIAVDAAGAWLTTVKAFRDPDSETLATWWLDAASNLLGVLAVGTLNVTLLSYPAYLLLANGSVVAAIYLARLRKTNVIVGDS